MGIGGTAILCSINPALRTERIRRHSGQESRTAPDSELEKRVYSYVPGEPKVRHLYTRLTQNHSLEHSFVAPSRLRMRRGDLGLVSQPEISRVDVLSFYAYSAKLLLFACSCASSDSASLPLRGERYVQRLVPELDWMFIDATSAKFRLPTIRELSHRTSNLMLWLTVVGHA